MCDARSEGDVVGCGPRREQRVSRELEHVPAAFVYLADGFREARGDDVARLFPGEPRHAEAQI